MVDGKDILAIVLSYAIGCVSTGYYLVRLRTGKDIRKFGSRSTGARNVARLLGRTGFLITFSGDFAKGVITLWAAKILTHQAWAVTASLISVVIGHIWPAQLGFKGGKGIAVSLGALLIFDYRLAVACCLVFCLCIVCLRKYMLSGLIAVAAAPAAAVVAGHTALDIAGITGLAFLIIFAHRDNIAGLVRVRKL
jgi:glycerol-3-phosphate acyltransferase PlsY